MDYTELKVYISPEGEGREIITALLAEAGYESFKEEADFLAAYIPSKDFNKEAVESINENLPDFYKFSFSHKLISDKNWNEKWESNYNPVNIDDRVSIRAPFHKANKNFDYEIIIEPKMSFGTAHHPTTAQMIKLMLAMDFSGKSVLDMGCGTSVLAILASKAGAKTIDAVDNDEWAYRNSLENVARNNIENIKVYLDDAAFLNDDKKAHYDVIIANINRNILLNDLEKYARSLKNKGFLLMSGFYEKDLEMLKDKAGKYDLEYILHISDSSWVAAKWTKN